MAESSVTVNIPADWSEFVRQLREAADWLEEINKSSEEDGES